MIECQLVFAVNDMSWTGLVDFKPDHRYARKPCTSFLHLIACVTKLYNLVSAKAAR